MGDIMQQQDECAVPPSDADDGVFDAVSAFVDNIRSVNHSFDTCVIRVCYTGRNRKNSSISEAAIRRAIPSLYNCPVVCRYDPETDTIGGHDMAIKNDGGHLRLVNKTEPVGVIPESAPVWFEDDADDNGTMHTYLCTTAILWKRQEAYRKIKEEGIVDQSMEIKVSDEEVGNDGVVYINDFQFTALTLIGVEPVFEGARATVYSMEDYRKDLNEMLLEWKQSVSEGNLGASLVYSLKGENVADDNGTPGGAAEKPDATEETEPMEKEEKYAMMNAIRDGLGEALSAAKLELPCGDVVERYWFIDADIDQKVIYCEDRKDYTLYGFNYEVDGDIVKIDFESKKRMKYAIVDFDYGSEGEPQDDPIGAAFSMLGKRADDAAEQLKTANEELFSLREFKETTEKANKAAEKKAVFSMFSDLDGIEEFEALKESNDDFTKDVLEEKCFAIRGRHIDVEKASPKAQEDRRSAKLIVETPVVKEQEPYGGLFEKYSK